MTPIDQLEPEALNEGAFADPGHAGDADALCSSGVRKEFRQQRLGAIPIVGGVRLDEGDCPTERRPVVFADAAKEIIEVERYLHHRVASII